VVEKLTDKIAPSRAAFCPASNAIFLTRLQPPGEKNSAASHYLATNWEFQIIYTLNGNLYGLEATREQIENEIEEHYDLAGVQKLTLGKKTRQFVDLVGQLRFQQRWAQSPGSRKPRCWGICSSWPSLPIFAPWSWGLRPPAVQQLFRRPFPRPARGPDQGHRLSRQALRGGNRGDHQGDRSAPGGRADYALLPASWQQEIRYFTEDEFKSKIIRDNKVLHVTTEEINLKYNEDRYSPWTGKSWSLATSWPPSSKPIYPFPTGLRQDTWRKAAGPLRRISEKVVSTIDFGSCSTIFTSTSFSGKSLGLISRNGLLN